MREKPMSHMQHDAYQEKCTCDDLINNFCTIKNYYIFNNRYTKIYIRGVRTDCYNYMNIFIYYFRSSLC